MDTRVTGVFEGGGIKGIALTGAAAAALDSGYEFGQVVGTSAGAMVASLVAAGFSSDELRRVVADTEWPRLLTSRSSFRKNLSMITRLGFHSGSRLGSVVRSLLRSKGIRTFSDLPVGALKVVATDLSHGRGIVFPDDLPRIGHDPSAFSVARAVRMSSSVPFMFSPVRLVDRVTGEEMMMADGAMAARFPVQLVPRDRSSVGFRLRPPVESHTHYEIKGPVSLATAVIGAGITAREDLPFACGPLERVVEIEIDHDSMDFDVDRTKALEMFDFGYNAARNQLPFPEVIDEHLTS
ncbi:MAG: patatin-like phospholipase family protein [Actinomycetota bacterium]|nr:patatin-like phospholipase family protein [Actinomycetota bacterium]